MKGRSAGREAGFLTLLGPGLRVVCGGEGRRTGLAKLRQPPFLHERALLCSSSPPPFHSPFFFVPPKTLLEQDRGGEVVLVGILLSAPPSPGVQHRVSGL